MDFDKPKVYGDTSITDGLVIVNGLENLIQYCLQLNQSRVWPKNIEFETFFYDAQKAIHHKHWAWKRDRVLIAIESILILTST